MESRIDKVLGRHDKDTTPAHERYPAIPAIGRLYRILGWVWAFITALLCFGGLLLTVHGGHEGGAGFGLILIGILIGAPTTLLFFAASQVIQLLMDVANDARRASRRTAQVLDILAKKTGDSAPEDPDD